MKKQLWVDVLTALSCVSVVYLHVNGIFWKHPNVFVTWITANAIESFFYFAVPIFFMISGYTLFGFSKRYTVREFWVKRFLRAGIPFLTWSVVWYVFNKCLSANPVWGVRDLAFLPWQIFNISVQHTYWFFPCLFACYAGICTFEFLDDTRRKSIFAWLIVGGFLSYSVLPFAEDILGISLKHSWQLPVVAGYMIYPLLGYIIGHSEPSKLMRSLIYVLGIAGLLVDFGTTTFFSHQDTGIYMKFKGYLNWPCVMYSCAVFTFVKGINWDRICNVPFVRFCLNEVRDTSLGVYLLHCFILLFIKWLFVEIDLWPSYASSILYRVLAPFIIVAVCVLMTRAIRKIPIVCAVMG